MVTCPTCGTSVEADFGMTTCPACESVFMVEIDGNVAPATAPLEEPQDIGVEVASADEGEAFDSESFVGGDSIASLDGAEAPTFESESAEGGFEPEATEIEGAIPQFDTSSEDEMPAVEESSDDEANEYSEDFLDTLDGGGSEPVADDGADPLGVTAFDSNEASQLIDGPFYYDVLISGIDTAYLKQQVIDALSDRRLSWSPEEIKKKIKMGQVSLPNLNPVRAVLAVLKLQALDVDVEWTQRPYTADPDGSKDQEA